MGYKKGPVSLTWSPFGGVCPSVLKQWPFTYSLPNFWPLSHPAPRRELGLSVSCYLTCWPSRISLPLRCLGAVVKSKGLERTPPLLGTSSPLCLLRSLPTKQGMAYTSGSSWCVRRLWPVASLRSWRGGFGKSLGWLWFLSSNCWRKWEREEDCIESCLGPGGSEGREWMAGARRLEWAGLFGRNSSSYSLWACV